MSTETRDPAPVFRNIDWNLAFQTISSRAGTTIARGRSAPSASSVAGQQDQDLGLGALESSRSALASGLASSIG